METIIGATAIIIAVAYLLARMEKRIMLKLNELGTAVSNLETIANPSETAADQAAVDQFTARVNAVAGRFAAPATDPPTDPTPGTEGAAPAETGDAASAGETGEQGAPAAETGDVASAGDQAPA